MHWRWWVLLMCVMFGAMGLWLALTVADGGGDPLSLNEPQPPQMPSALKPVPHTTAAKPASPGPMGEADHTAALAQATGWPTAELQALRDELRGHPQGEAEIQRVMAWLVFSGQWRAFDEQRRAGAGRDVLRPLALPLDAALARHWHQGELTGAQAVQIKSVLLDALHADEATRQAELNRWLAEHQPATAANKLSASR